MYTKLTELNLTTLIILGHEENLYLGGFMCSLSSSALFFFVKYYRHFSMNAIAHFYFTKEIQYCFIVVVQFPL